jgi:hypothetical protein
MIEHRFSVGQVVEARASLFGLTPPGPYKIMRLLPPTGTSNQYRLKIAQERQRMGRPRGRHLPER